MIRRLRLKFVLITMVIATLMLCVTLGLVLRFTGQKLELQTVQMMEQVAVSFSKPDFPERPDAPERPTPSEQFLVHLPHFVLFVDRQGEISVNSNNNSYHDLSDTELLRELVAAAERSSKPTGLLKAYDLRYFRASTPSGHRIVFADVSSEYATMSGLICTCLFIGILGFVIFLGISILLARWAIKPVEEAWNRQKQFVADASHELKTPLTVILTNAELLQSPDYGPEEKSRFADSILSMSRQMRGLVEGLLELARVDNGVIKSGMTPLDLSRLVSESVLIFEPLFFEAGLSLDSHLEEGVSTRGSQIHLQQVIGVLLDNASKYSTPGGHTRVELKRQCGHALLTVSNPGPEISREDRKNIFNRFYRCDPARTMNHSYGLGLSIAKHLVTEHGGKIWVESADGYNTFFVQLPL